MKKVKAVWIGYLVYDPFTGGISVENDTLDRSDFKDEKAFDELVEKAMNPKEGDQIFGNDLDKCEIEFIYEEENQ
ncbi:hypothetical protein [Fructobacillus evanidus]|uniref:Uncharacterized protein n=1 Tax=Fructobacillus evanidus TaxID=3064281 RepID=A0ABN9YIZ5_9LACO|nr:unnamed protein product [Fructobacillus sp. LMG 32999]CAK1222177.1 unnamed protein product [Fructobacillus sp. LMG 32999]CAK1225995.1 unnamed protein product [Fructobacillus sp. LMG 32999]CAK1226222.1 unnamed protein product [Fructobacillus sp. LMG 32999]CAK1226367.1 unnamed protein product [Fructobacillus sp. LMG 32999]